MNCARCGRKLRTSRELLKDRPGTVMARRGMCVTCYRAHPDFKPAKDHAAVQRDTASLAAYLSRRAPFRAKAGTL